MNSLSAKNFVSREFSSIGVHGTDVCNEKWSPCSWSKTNSVGISTPSGKIETRTSSPEYVDSMSHKFVPGKKDQRVVMIIIWAKPTNGAQGHSVRTYKFFPFRWKNEAVFLQRIIVGEFAFRFLIKIFSQQYFLRGSNTKKIGGRCSVFTNNLWP